MINTHGLSMTRNFTSSLWPVRVEIQRRPLQTKAHEGVGKAPYASLTCRRSVSGERKSPCSHVFSGWGEEMRTTGGTHAFAAQNHPKPTAWHDNTKRLALSPYGRATRCFEAMYLNT